MKFNKNILVKEFSNFYGKSLRRQMSSEVLDNLETIMLLVEHDSEWKSIPEIAYFLATIGWETAWTFAPIVERRASSSQTDVRRMQDRYWNTGYFGRGYVQLTWRENYEKLGKLIGVDLVRKPDELLKPSISYEVAAEGMRRGLFRIHPNGDPVKLSDYVSEFKYDFIKARNVINGDVEKNGPAIARFAVEILSSLMDAVIKEETSSHNAQTTPSDKNNNVTMVTDNKTQLSETKPQVEIPISKPWEAPIKIEPTVPTTTSGPKSLLTVISSFISSLGITGSAIYAAVTGIIPNLNPTTVLIVCLVCLTIVTCVYLASRIYIKNARENRAASLDKEILGIIADPYKSNVTINNGHNK